MTLTSCSMLREKNVVGLYLLRRRVDLSLYYPNDHRLRAALFESVPLNHSIRDRRTIERQSLRVAIDEFDRPECVRIATRQHARIWAVPPSPTTHPEG